MASQPRRESTSGIHHVMNRGGAGRRIFFDDEDRVGFGRRLALMHEEHEVSTLAYCLMDNHFHLLLQAPDAATLSTAMQHAMSIQVRRTNDRAGGDGPMCRSVFTSIPVETDRYLQTVTRYIHRNPLCMPGIEAPDDYRWSSHRAYTGRRPAPSFLDVAPVLSLFGGSRDRFAAFTEAGDTEQERPRLLPLTGADIGLLVRCGIAVDDLVHPDDEAKRQRLERTVLYLIADRTDRDDIRREVMVLLAPPSAKAAAEGVRRARRRSLEDPRVRRIVAWVEAEMRIPRTRIAA